MTVQCAACGQFVSYQDMKEGRASFHFEPDSHFGKEVIEWLCSDCSPVSHGVPVKETTT